jgi:phosphatidate cytidylyltransferase
MNNFWTRAITGTVFVVVLVGAILLGGWYMHITFGAIVLLGLLEFYKLFEKTDSQPQRLAGALIGILIYLLAILTLRQNDFMPGTRVYGNALIALIISSFVFIAILELFRKQKKPLENISLTVGGIIYVVFPFVLLNWLAINRDPQPVLHHEPPVFDQFWPVLSIFILIWCNDTFAYLTGKLLGRHKLFERISPKKTWEGFMGGLVFAILAAIILAYSLEQSYTKYVTYAIVAGVIGTLGDLVQSMLKRSVDVKDSGNILPGHGGILDRFDGVLFAAPVIFILEGLIFR